MRAVRARLAGSAMIAVARRSASRWCATASKRKATSARMRSRIFIAAMRSGGKASIICASTWLIQASIMSIGPSSKASVASPASTHLRAGGGIARGRRSSHRTPLPRR
jgi:hypothetical protein